MMGLWILKTKIEDNTFIKYNTFKCVLEKYKFIQYLRLLCWSQNSSQTQEKLVAILSVRYGSHLETIKIYIKTKR